LDATLQLERELPAQKQDLGLDRLGRAKQQDGPAQGVLLQHRNDLDKAYM
jgi:hypothetical protein